MIILIIRDIDKSKNDFDEIGWMIKTRGGNS
jgi:hypothetical protein